MDRLRTVFRGRTGLALIIAMSMAFGMVLATNFMERDTAYATDHMTSVSGNRAALHQFEEAFTSLVEEMLPSVVSITSERTVETRRGSSLDDLFREFPFPFPWPQAPDTPETQRPRSFGTGVIVRADGYILTNNHVVGDAESVTVTLQDGREFDGTVSGDPRSDLALIKIDAANLPTAKLGDSDKVKVGSWAIAIGSPFQLDQTVTFGVISATGRQARVPDGQAFYYNLIQTDASINPGNSGGPLINSHGEVIGINTLIRSSGTGGNIGIGFAIPVNTAKFVLEQLIEHGVVTRGYLGLVPKDISPREADRLGIEKGVLIESVEVGSPADKAGIQVEDVIVEFDGRTITNETHFRDTVAATPPNKEVEIVVVRDRTQHTLTATLGEPPAGTVARTPRESETKLGFNISAITPELASQHNMSQEAQGVVVTSVAPGGAAARAGIQPGLLIVRANDITITSVEDFNEATKDLKSRDTLRLWLETAQRRFLVQYTLD